MGAQRGRGAVVRVGAAATALAAAAVLAGCAGEPARALHVDVCVGADSFPASGTAVVELVQGGRQVASAQGSAPGSDMSFGFTVPELPTAVLLDGRPLGTAAGVGGVGDVDPTSTEAPAPTDDQVEAAQHADAAHTTTIGIGTPGCSVGPQPPDGS